MKKSFKSKLMAIAGLVVASSLAITSSFIASAETSLNGNTNSGGGMGTGIDPAYAHKFMAYPENQGYRISIVDKSGNRVANSVDIVNYIPSHIWSGIGIPTDNSSNKDEDYGKGFNQYKNYIGWEERSKDGGKAANFLYSGGIKTEEFEKATWNPFGVPNMTVNGKTIQTEMYPKAVIESGFIINYNDTAEEKNKMGMQVDYIVDKASGNHLNGKLQPVKVPLPSVLNSDGKTFRAGGSELTAILSTNMINKKDNSNVVNYAAILINMRVSKYNNSGSKLGYQDYLFKFADNTLQATVGTGAEGNKVSQASIIVEKGYKVVVEPLYWYVPEVITSDANLIATRSSNGSSMRHMRFVCYGTVSYLAKYTENILHTKQNFTEDELSKMWAGPNWGGAGLGVTSLMVSKNDNELKIVEPSTVGLKSRPSLADCFSLFDLASGNRYKTTGYSMHIYDNILNTNPAISTSTYDSVNYPPDGYKEGEAPEPPTAPEGKPYVDVGKDHKKNIVKFYGVKDTKTNQIVYTSNYTRTNTVSTINVEDEGNYKVDSYFLSSKFKEPSSQNESYDSFKSSLPNSSSGTGSGRVTIPPESDVTTLYLKLIKDKDSVDLGGINQLKLYQNELSYPYSLSAFREQLEEVYQSFPDKNKSGRGRHSGNDDDDDDWYCSWSRHLDDGSYNISLHNTFNYNDTTFIGTQGKFNGAELGKVSTSDGEKSALLSSFNTEVLNPNWQFTYYRDKAKDRVSLYPEYNNATVKSEMSQIGIGVGGYTPDGGRVAQENSGEFTNNFKMKYDYESLDNTLSWDSSGCDEHGDSGSYSGTQNKSLSDVNNVYNKDGNLSTEYFLGKNNIGNAQPDNAGSSFKFNIGGANYTFKNNLNTKQTSAQIEFYPYTKMKYNTPSGEGTAYVTSTNKSSLAGITRVDVGVYKGGNGYSAPLTLDSNQWNIHQRTKTFYEKAKLADKNSVLPGGALYTIKDGKNEQGGNGTMLGIHSYQVVIEDSAAGRLAGGARTQSQAINELNSLYGTAKDSLDNFELVQWVGKGVGKEFMTNSAIHSLNAVEYLFSGSMASEMKQITGKNGTNTFNGLKLNKDDIKYYLRNGVTGPNRSDIDILEEKDETVIWSIYSDSEGNVTVKKNGTAIASINKTQGVGSLLGNAEVKDLDDNTKAVTNYVNSIDRNKGSDRNGNAWYNEGFEGITVVEGKKMYRIGLGANGGDNQPVRTSALDPKLTGTLTDRTELFSYFKEDGQTVDPERVRTTIFMTSDKSLKYESKSAGYIGSINGLDITIRNITQMLHTKPFYIPNSTVMDLN
jgi:hypothetical protein